MNISILLPYKENFSPEYAGAVSIFINAITKKSLFKRNITIYGSTRYKKKLSKNYVNIPLKKVAIELNKEISSSLAGFSRTPMSFSALLPSITKPVASPPSSRIILGASPSPHSRMRWVYAQYSSNV